MFVFIVSAAVASRAEASAAKVQRYAFFHNQQKNIAVLIARTRGFVNCENVNLIHYSLITFQLPSLRTVRSMVRKRTTTKQQVIKMCKCLSENY